MSHEDNRRRQAEDSVPKRRKQQKVAQEAQTHLTKARESEAEADPSKMSPEDRAIFHYLQAVTKVLEQDYDILLEEQE